MNNMKKMALLLLIAAASNSAKAQNVVKLKTGEPYTITSSAEADATIKYQWYRDGSAIPGAIGTSYTVPTQEAYGSNVEFKRATYLEGCPERKFSNAVVITWCNLKLGETCWADVNVAQPGTFAPRPDKSTEFYQWNQPNKAWPITGAISDPWPTGNAALAWTSTPCPEGWRLPTRTEIDALRNTTGDTNGNTIGGYWAAANARGNATAGRFFGSGAAASNPANPNATALPAGVSICALPSPMVGCIFLSASGHRSSIDGALSLQTAYAGFWSSTQYSAVILAAYGLNFNSTTITAIAENKANGFTVRCVQ